MSNAIIYNITIQVQKSFVKEWKHYMLNKHIPELMETGCFSHYYFNKVLAEDPSGDTFAMQLISPNKSSFEEYQRKHMKVLQEDHKSFAGERYVAFRTLLEVLNQGKA